MTASRMAFCVCWETAFTRFPESMIRSLKIAPALMAGMFGSTSLLEAQATPPAPKAIYHPDQGDIVVRGGTRAFNRPLYGGNTGFRIEAGDLPEFALHLPKRGGNLRLGWLAADNKSGFWFHQSATRTSRYRAGSMVYELADPRLGTGSLQLTVLPAGEGEGLVARMEIINQIPSGRFVWVFGGNDGHPGRRNGDLNAENEQLAKFFRFTPERAAKCRYAPEPGGFTCSGPAGTLFGRLPESATPHVADAKFWDDPAKLLASKPAPNAASVLVGTLEIPASGPVDLAILKSPKPAAGVLRDVYNTAQQHREEIAGRVKIETPDPWLNATSGALNVAADAIWDSKSGRYMHGAIGWRVPLLGWRGPYAGDALGRPERTRQHIESYTAGQITTPPPATMPPPDEEFNLARSIKALNTNGMFAGKNLTWYDMNTVAVDAMLRHLMWTGDRPTAERFWPVLERHLAWQKRLFRRPFPDENSPLYEGYACIWASDELIYSGGGATHATAYQFCHQQMAARLAEWLGKDPSPFRKEAEAIARTMRRELWLPQEGVFAEYRDLLGRKLAHPSPALWSFYHTVDSDACNPAEAWQMSRFLETRLARFPMPGGDAHSSPFQLATTNWQPYIWSINNVALSESMHTALALWQAQRPELAWPLMKGAISESMFASACPGNVGMTTPSDYFSGERYRDFADGAGIMARTLVEGLFGIRPDLIAGQLTVSPGFPGNWDKASIQHPSVKYAFSRQGTEERHQLRTTFAKPVRILLRIPANRDQVKSITVNGSPADWQMLAESLGRPMLEVRVTASADADVRISWDGAKLETSPASQVIAQGSQWRFSGGPAKCLALRDPQGCLADPITDPAGGHVQGVAKGAPGHRTVFVQLRQGAFQWWQALHLEIVRPLEIIAADPQATDALRVKVHNRSTTEISGRLVLNHADDQGKDLVIPAGGESPEITWSSPGMMPGTQHLRFSTSTGEVVATIAHWMLKAPETPQKWDTLPLSKLYNQRLNRIFQEEYRSPRSPYCSLAIPKRGIGGWCHFESKVLIDDTGLRALADSQGVFKLAPLGIPFQIPGPGDAPNAAFVSQWVNHPKEIQVPLDGKASRIALLMAGSTNPMQSQLDNGELVVTYTDGNSERLALHNPSNWWPIDQDYHIDHAAFTTGAPPPPRLLLQSGTLQLRDADGYRSKSRNQPASIPGGAATILDLPLDPQRELKSLTLRSIANDAIIGLLAASLQRP